MSAESSAVSKEHFDYIARHTTPDDEFLISLKTAARAEGLPEIWISPEQGALMQILLRLVRARVVIEVGTLAGYSAIWMARALPPEGRLHTIEIEPKHADFAAQWIARSDVAERVTLHRGDARNVLSGFTDGSADAAFIDADKRGYRRYLDACLRIVRPGGLIMVDNAFAFGQLLDEHPTDRDVPTVREFNDYMAGVKELQSVIIPIGDGLWVGVRRELEY